MNSIDFSKLRGWLLGLIATAAAFITVATMVTTNGVLIPTDLGDEAVMAAQAADYERPDDLEAECLDSAEVTDEVAADSRAVLALEDAELEACDRQVLPYRTDTTLWGFMALAVLAALAFALRKLSDGRRTVGDLVGLAVLAGAFILGGVFGRPIWELVTNWDMGGQLFWRGVIAAAIVVGSALWAYQPRQAAD